MLDAISVNSTYRSLGDNKMKREEEGSEDVPRQILSNQVKGDATSQNHFEG